MKNVRIFASDAPANYLSSLILCVGLTLLQLLASVVIAERKAKHAKM
jgi:hypothetical protein